VREEIPLAPASSHIHLSSPACVKVAAKQGATPSNTHLFRCFHRVQAPKIMSELRPLLAPPPPPTKSFVLLHHDRKSASSGCGEIACKLICRRKVNQNCLAKTQETNRWSIVSFSWSHRGHLSGWLRPRRARRSAVQHFLCAKSKESVE
jgi:hypothetical protein